MEGLQGKSVMPSSNGEFLCKNYQPRFFSRFSDGHTRLNLIFLATFCSSACTRASRLALAALAHREHAGHKILKSEFWSIVEQNPADDPVANSELGTSC